MNIMVHNVAMNEKQNDTWCLPPALPKGQLKRTVLGPTVKASTVSKQYYPRMFDTKQIYLIITLTLTFEQPLPPHGNDPL